MNAGLHESRVDQNREDPMSVEIPSTHQKALSINLDSKIYGTIAEIGAAQEVARWFFRVGAAAGSVAKTMSAYDMQVSDDIYGKAGRYVSRERVDSMLNKEYSLLVDRLAEKRGHDTRFFAFCNTVAARNFAGTNECHGWVGLRFQSEVVGEPNTIILHINMFDDTNVAQQEAVGILGVNLIYTAFFGPGDPDLALASLADNIGVGRLEADLVDVSGPAFVGVDSIATGLAIVHSGLAEAVLFDCEGNQQPPTEILRKRPAIIKRTSLRYSSTIGSTDFDAGAKKLSGELPASERSPLYITEFSISSVHAGGDADAAEPLNHVRKLVGDNDWVMLTRLRQSFKLSSYIRRYSQQPLRFVMGVSTFVMLLSEKFYVDSGSGLLEATGKLYANDVKVYVQPMRPEDFHLHLGSVGLGPDWVDLPDTGDKVSIHNIAFRGPMHMLFQYLLQSGSVDELEVDD
jgi:hypothetical protein